MALNLDNYKDSLVEAWRDVMNEKSPINWALFGYDGQTFDLKLISTGDGGIEEMMDDFNSGKIMYGLCRVKLEEKNVEKIALINWQGEGAPLARKGTCANHVTTIKNFFKGVHVTINARTEEEVEPDVIIAHVAKATSGGGIRMSSSMEPDVQPVGTHYKRVNPKEEINSKAKDAFWLNEEKEEERRKRDEQLKLQKFSRNEVQLLRRESQDYFNEQEKNDDVFSNPVSPTPPPTSLGFGKSNGTNGTIVSPTASSPVSSGKNSSLGFGTDNTEEERKSVSPAPVFSNSFVASEKAAALKASLPRRNNNTNDNLVRQRIKSFDSNNGMDSCTPTQNGGKNGIGHSNESESLSVLRRKQLFENGGPASTVSVTKRNVAAEIKELQQQESLKQHSNKSPEPPISNNRRTQSPEQTNQQRIISPVKAKSPSPQPQTIPFQFQSKTVMSNQSIKAYNLPFHIGGSVTGKLAQQINRNGENGENENDDQNQKKEEQIVPVSIEPPPSFQDNNNTNGFVEKKNPVIEKPPRTTIPVANPAVVPVIENDSSAAHDEQSAPTSIEITHSMGLCARALYDYQAADDTEITFDPGDLITNIEQIDQGWWEGTGPAGLYGLFPANYVELLN